jgi:hypothetical protein
LALDGRIGRRRQPQAPPLLYGRKEGGRKGIFAKNPLPYLLFVKEPSTLFAKESLIFISFANKPFFHINLIINIPLTPFRMTQVVSKIQTKPLLSQI